MSILFATITISLRRNQESTLGNKALKALIYMYANHDHGWMRTFHYCEKG